MSVRYRRLSTTELQEMEKEFIDFLVVNGIDADTWTRMKQNDPDRAGILIDLFSDLVFDKIVSNARFIEHRTPTTCFCFHCPTGSIFLAAIETIDPEADLTDNDYLQIVLNGKSKDAKVYTSEKPYLKARNEEVWELIRKGGEITNGELYKSITLATVT